MKNVNYVSCSSRILPTLPWLLTTVRVFSSTPCSQTHSVYFFPVRSDTRFATHKKKREAKTINCTIWVPNEHDCRFQWLRGLKRVSAAVRLLRLRVRIPPGTWMPVSCERCVSGRETSLRRADHSSRGVLLTVLRRCVWSRNLKNEESWPALGRSATVKKIYIMTLKMTILGRNMRARIRFIIHTRFIWR